MPTTMNDVLATALDKLPKHSRPEAGEYSGKAVLAVQFDIRVGQDHPQRVVNQIPWMRMFTIAISKLNRATGETVEAIARAALAGEPIEEEEISARAKRAVDALCEATTKVVKGPVTGSCTVTEVVGFELLGGERR